MKREFLQGVSELDLQDPSLDWGCSGETIHAAGFLRLHCLAPNKTMESEQQVSPVRDLHLSKESATLK